MGSGAYAEYTEVDSSTAARITLGIKLEIAAAVLLQGLTAYSFITRAYTVQPKDWVLVQAAAGGTGQLLVQMCRSKGACVIGTASTPEKVELALSLGCEHVINYSTEDVVARVKTITSGAGVAVVFDGVGKSTFDQSLQVLANSGTMVSFGNASGKVPPADIFILTPKNLKLIRPSLMGYLRSQQEFTEMANGIFDILLKEHINVNTWKVWELEQAGEAHKALESRATTGKLLLTAKK